MQQCSLKQGPGKAYLEGLRLGTELLLAALSAGPCLAAGFAVRVLNFQWDAPAQAAFPPASTGSCWLALSSHSATSGASSAAPRPRLPSACCQATQPSWPAARLTGASGWISVVLGMTIAIVACHSDLNPCSQPAPTLPLFRVWFFGLHTLAIAFRMRHLQYDHQSTPEPMFFWPHLGQSCWSHPGTVLLFS